MIEPRALTPRPDPLPGSVPAAAQAGRPPGAPGRPAVPAGRHPGPGPSGADARRQPRRRGRPGRADRGRAVGPGGGRGMRLRRADRGRGLPRHRAGLDRPAAHRRPGRATGPRSARPPTAGSSPTPRRVPRRWSRPAPRCRHRARRVIPRRPTRSLPTPSCAPTGPGSRSPGCRCPPRPDGNQLRFLTDPGFGPSDRVVFVSEAGRAAFPTNWGDWLLWLIALITGTAYIGATGQAVLGIARVTKRSDDLGATLLEFDRSLAPLLPQVPGTSYAAYRVRAELTVPSRLDALSYCRTASTGNGHAGLSAPVNATTLSYPVRLQRQLGAGDRRQRGEPRAAADPVR